MSDDLVERVAQAMWMADVEPYDPADRIPFEQAPEGAQAYCRAEARAAIAVVLEEAARVAENMPHWTDNGPPLGKMPTGRNDIAAAIRAMVKHD